MGDQDRPISQEELDTSAQYVRHLLRIFSKIPPNYVDSTLASLVLSWCRVFDDPEEKLNQFTAELKEALPRLAAQIKATRQ